MIFPSALCFVLVLASTSANTESKAKAEALSNKITSVVVGELVQVANAAKGTNISAAELQKKLLDTTRSAFKRMEPEIKDLGSLSGESADKVAKHLAQKISKDNALISALPKDGKITPRAMRQLGPLMIRRTPDGREIYV